MRRFSRHRQPVLDTLREASGPLSAHEVQDRLTDTGIGLATVYRLLNEAVDDGGVVAVDWPGGPKRFELADLPDHHHFECNACHKVFALQGVPERLDRLVPDGFQIEQHELILSGRCPDCGPAT